MNIFKQLIKSIYSPKDIATFINQRKRKSVLFLFILALITLLPSTYYIGQTFIENKKDISTIIENEMPDFTIEDNHLVSSEQAPVIYNGNNVTYIFDSTNSLTVNDITDPSTIAFLYNGLYFSEQLINYDVLGIQSKADFTLLLEPLTKDNTLVYSVMIAIYIVSAITLFVVLNVEIALISLVGMLISRNQYTFGQMYRIAPYAMTLTTFFFFVMDWLQITVPFASFTALLVTLIVLYLTIVELKKSDDKQQLA